MNAAPSSLALQDEKPARANNVLGAATLHLDTRSVPTTQPASALSSAYDIMRLLSTSTEMLNTARVLQVLREIDLVRHIASIMQEYRHTHVSVKRTATVLLEHLRNTMTGRRSPPKVRCNDDLARIARSNSSRIPTQRH